MNLLKGLLGAVIGAMPGIILVLLAQFVIEGEMQLTVGAPGFVIAALGAVAGFIVGWILSARKAKRAAA
jgi:hypothetical protein